MYGMNINILRKIWQKNRILMIVCLFMATIFASCGVKTIDVSSASEDKEIVEAQKEGREPRIISHTMNASEKLEGKAKYFFCITKHTKYDEAGEVLETISFDYINRGQVVKEYTESLSDDDKLISEYMYDQDGNWIEHVEYLNEYKPEKYTYIERNEHGDIVYQYDFSYQAEVPVISEVYYEYEYDSEGHIISLKSSTKPTVTYYEYDVKGNKIEEYTYNADGDKITLYSYDNSYDKFDRLAKVVIRYPDGAVEQVYEYTYYKDEPMQKKRKLQHYKEDSYFYTVTDYAIDGTVTAAYTYSVDDNDNMIKGSREGYELVYNEERRISSEIVYVPNIYFEEPDTIRTIYEYTYEYDKYGNLIKMTLLNADGEPTSYETWEYDKLKLIVSPHDDYEIGKKLKRHFQ